MSRKNVTIFKLMLSKDKKHKILKPNIGKYGVAAITVTLNDGTVLNMDATTGMFGQTPKNKVIELMEKGIIDETTAQKRLESIPDFVVVEYDLPVKG